MAGPNHLLSELHRQLARLDDEGLAALASAGLLRRARKDLESQQPEVASTEDSVGVSLAGQVVTLDARGPTHARCTCPAKTICQHVLAACLFLKSLPSADGAPQTGEDAADRDALQKALLAISLVDLIRFAGKASIREALRAVEAEELAEISLGKTLVIHLARQGIEFRYAGGGPESLISDFQGRAKKRLTAQAILSVQRALGVQHVLAEQADQDRGSAEIHDLRVTVLRKVTRLLLECVDVGLAHLSDTLIERFAALATVTEGAKLHRLSLALTRLADHVDLILERHARADSADFLAELAGAYALAEALHDPASWNRVELVGEVRSSYKELAVLELYCAGAYPWQTGSGYWGLTVLFWSPSQRRWFTYSDSRPLGTLGFNPTDAYRAGSPWRGCPSPATIMGRRVILHQASVNSRGRLSGSSSTVATVDATTVPDFAGRVFTSWIALFEHACSALQGIGLVEPAPLVEYVVLRPRRFLVRRFEESSQTLSWPVEDEHGETLELRLEYSDMSAAAIERLDAFEPESGVRIIAELRWSSGLATARPLTLLRATGDRVIDNLFLDQSAAITSGGTLLGRLRSALTPLPSMRNAQPTIQRMHATERMLSELNTLLLRIAERGTSAHTGFAAAFATALQRLNDSGLTLLDPGTTIETRTVLRARYLIQVAEECLARNRSHEPNPLG